MLISFIIMLWTDRWTDRWTDIGPCLWDTQSWAAPLEYIFVYTFCVPIVSQILAVHDISLGSQITIKTIPISQEFWGPHLKWCSRMNSFFSTVKALNLQLLHTCDGGPSLSVNATRNIGPRRLACFASTVNNWWRVLHLQAKARSGSDTSKPSCCTQRSYIFRIFFP